MYLGCHISIAKGFFNAGKDALSIDANTFQFFTRNPRGGKAKALDFGDLAKLEKLMKENNFGALLAHAPYTLNMASSKESVRTFAREMFKDDLERMESLPSSLYNFHPGSHTGSGIESGIEKITEILNETITGEETTMILLETMSGKGTELGITFEELKMIRDGVKHKELIGVCLDTCHIYSAGYDIVNDLDGVLNHFDEVLGIDKIKAIHLNDSLTEFNSRKDRHAKIGEGVMGLEAIERIVTHPKLQGIPFLLETPNELDGHKEEIKLLRDIISK